MEPYIPQPIDTTGVQLPRDLYPLMEELSRSNHDTWAKNRIEEGWTYGPNRDDIKKQNPCIVSYENLPEEEKNYDRNTSGETLKSIYKLGFAISKRVTGNVLVVGCYSSDNIDLFKNEAAKHELQLDIYNDWTSAKLVLERDLSRWNAIILDTKGKLQIDEEPTDYFLRNVLDDLNSLYSRNRNEVPWFILPNEQNDFTEALIKFTVGRDREKKGWGPYVFNKDNAAHELFFNIGEILPNTRNYRIKCVYEEVFDVLDKLYPDRAKNILTNILLPLHYPEIFYSFDPTDYYNGLRRILESTFEVCYKYGMIPANIFYHENKLSINLRYSCDYLIYGEVKKESSVIGRGICSQSIGIILDSILNIANEGSHMGAEYKTEGLYFSIMAYSLQLCDVITWLGKYIELNGLISLDEIMQNYEGKTVIVSQDADGNYYYEKCIFPSNPYIKYACERQISIKIENIVFNTRFNKITYPFFAYYRK